MLPTNRKKNAMSSKTVMNGKEIRMVTLKNARVVLFVNGRMQRSYASRGEAISAAKKVAG
jgi:hypothetical protein